MLSLSYTAALLLCAGALAAGFVIGWAHFQLRTGTDFVPLSRHSEDLLSMRRRYRRRLRAVRDAMLRHRLNEGSLRAELKAALARGVEDAQLLDAATAEADGLRARLSAADRDLAASGKALAGLQERERALAGELGVALEKLAAIERERGLMRIERDELVARTQRLQALPAADIAMDAPPDDITESTPRVAAGALRAELADRNSRIHELECELRESAARVAELESNLHRWMYRIAPLALHLKMKRERARSVADDRSAAKEPGDDDLKLIRGIGRGLEKKLRAEGITRIEQLAAMSTAELANLAVRVGVAASRPLRDRWAEQAREHCSGAQPLAGNG